MTGSSASAWRGLSAPTRRSFPGACGAAPAWGTLAYEPETILMDEPFGALDAQLRLVMHDELLKLWAATRKTIVFVTHDLAEAITLADRVAVFSARPGRIRAIEPIMLPRPRDVFRVRFDSTFGALHDRLWSYLEANVRRDVKVA